MKIRRSNPRFLPLLITMMLIGSATALVAAESGGTRLSEPVEVTVIHEFFGGTLPESGEPISLADLVNNNQDYLDHEVLVETRIAKVCQKKGCFFDAQQGPSTVRVTFKDYGFFIPTDSGGKDVILLGTFTRKSVSQEQAEHYAADLGETKAPASEAFEYSIVATAVKIPRS